MLTRLIRLKKINKTLVFEGVKHLKAQDLTITSYNGVDYKMTLKGLCIVHSNKIFLDAISRWQAPLSIVGSSIFAEKTTEIGVWHV